jgi:hypothetical protein
MAIGVSKAKANGSENKKKQRMNGGNENGVMKMAQWRIINEISKAMK